MILFFIYLFISIFFAAISVQVITYILISLIYAFKRLSRGVKR